MKKVLVIMAVIVLAFSQTNYAYAQNATVECSEEQFNRFLEENPICAGIRDDQTGKVYYLEAVIEDIDYTDNSVKYGVYLPLRALNGENTIQGYDNTSSAYCSLTIKYLMQTYTMGIMTGYAYLLTEVSGYWAIQVYNVSVTSATVTYGCTGMGYNSSVVGQVNTIYPPGYWGGFTQQTGFSSYVLDALGTVGANMELNFLMGTTRTWTFWMQNKILDSNPSF